MGYRAPIDFQRIDDLIKNKGVWLDWVRTMRCPCVSDSGYPQSLDPVCEGTGWAKVETKRMKALWTGHNANRSREPHGTVDTDTRQVTPPRNVRLAIGDWVVMKQFPVRTSDVLVHGSATPATSRLLALFPVRILAIRAIRDGALYEFPEGAFSLGPAGTVVWADAAVEPQPAEKITVEYEHYEAYQVIPSTKPMQRGTEDRRLPDRATVKLITRRTFKPGLDAGWNVESQETRYYP